MKEKWEFNSLTPKDVYDRVMTAYEEIAFAVAGLRKPEYDIPDNSAVFPIMESAQKRLAEIFEDINRVNGHKEGGSDE